MKTSTFISLLFIFCNLIAKSITPDIKINSYNILTKISNTSMDVNVTFEINKLLNNNSNQIKLLFNSDTDIKSIKYLVDKDWISATYNFYGKNSLLINLPKNTYDSMSYKLMFEYSFPIDTLNDTALIIDRGHRWYPLVLNQIFSFKLTTYVPTKYRVLSSGELIEEIHNDESSIFVWESEKPVFKLPLIVFNPSVYNKTELFSQDRDLIFYTFTQDTSQVKKILNQIDLIINYFTETIGSYRYKSLILFETEGFRGINVGSGLLTIGKESIDMINKGYKDGMILTTAQQWFGASVFANFNKPGFFFLSLSLPHYLRLMYVNYSGGRKAFDESIQSSMVRYKEFAGTEKDIPIIDVDKPNTREKSILLYAKGPYILSKIHKEMGDENWITFLRELYKSFSGKIITFETFTDYLAKNDKTGDATKLLVKLMNEKGLSGE